MQVRGYHTTNVIAEDQPTRVLGRRVYLETFGCQMNELDSELVRGHLTALGYQFTKDRDKADVVLFNTCSVREQAENKVLSRIGLIGVAKRQGSNVILGVIGCMAEREGVDLIRKYPQVDLMCGPGELDKLPMLLDNALKAQAVELADRVALQGNRTRRSATLTAAHDNLEMLDLSRAFDPDGAAAGGRSAYVRITRGCNKFCTYCVVPFTRGAEVHRPPDHIIDECRRLAQRGVIEITLLGQTVNHYVYTHGPAVSVDGQERPQVGPGASAFRGKTTAANGRAGQITTSFAELLRRVHDEVPAIRRLRFVTSYARDFGDDILEVMSQCPRICRYLHLPVQSGSDRILRLMNRGYTLQEYLGLVDRARRILPDVCLAGDIIVGFPTETDEDFELTKDLLRRVRFKNHFIFKYSPRPGTAAMSRLPDDVPGQVKRRRNHELLELQAQISDQVHGEYVGRTVDVFVEKLGQGRTKASGGFAQPVRLGWERPRVQVSGRTQGDLITVFDLPEQLEAEDLIGRIIPVRITGSGPLILQGEPIRQPASTGDQPMATAGSASADESSDFVR
ncbi:MAG: MiaB/RimO family radical SAM methylthiotransferase [Phycisphaerales bacterium]